MEKIKKYIIEIRKNDYFFGDDTFNNLEEAIKELKNSLEDCKNHYSTTKDDSYTLYSAEYIKDEDGALEEIEDSYKEIISISIKDYYNLDYEQKEKLFILEA